MCLLVKEKDGAAVYIPLDKKPALLRVLSAHGWHTRGNACDIIFKAKGGSNTITNKLLAQFLQEAGIHTVVLHFYGAKIPLQQFLDGYLPFMVPNSRLWVDMGNYCDREDFTSFKFNTSAPHELRANTALTCYDGGNLGSESIGSGTLTGIDKDVRGKKITYTNCDVPPGNGRTWKNMVYLCGFKEVFKNMFGGFTPQGHLSSMFQHKAYVQRLEEILECCKEIASRHDGTFTELRFEKTVQVPACALVKGADGQLTSVARKWWSQQLQSIESFLVSLVGDDTGSITRIPIWKILEC
jgi:hypothetical protein